MSTTLTIIRPGILTTLQDTGRTGYRTCGVPLSGALDTIALQIANRLAGNPPDIAAIEMLYAGATLEARGGSVRVALACTDAVIEDGQGHAQPVCAWRSVVLRAGERLRMGRTTGTAASYLAVEGGFAIRPVLGSLSTTLHAALGGFHGRALRAGDEIELSLSTPSARGDYHAPLAHELRAPACLRVMAGPQDESFEPDAIRLLANSKYAISPASDRSGVRLEGARLNHRNGHDLLSEPVATGSIQVPGSGQPIILLADHPTVGGYPKIATVISADLAAAGRLRIGHSVGFTVVDEMTARCARTELQQWLVRITETMRRIP